MTQPDQVRDDDNIRTAMSKVPSVQREDWTDDVLAPLERFDYPVAHEPLPEWIRKTHKPMSGPYREYGTLPTLIGSYFAGSTKAFKGTPERALAWIHEERELNPLQRRFLTDLLESVHPVELGALLATSSITLYELVRILHRCDLTTGWLATSLNDLALHDATSTPAERDVTTTAWAWVGQRLGTLVETHGGHLWLRGGSALTSAWRHRPASRLELAVGRKSWDQRVGTGKALPIHDPDEDTPGRPLLALCRSLDPPPERAVYSKHDDWWRWDAPWGSVCLYRGEDDEPPGDSTDPETELKRESANAAVTRMVEGAGPHLVATDCLDLAEAMDRTPGPFQRNRRQPTWCRAPIMYLRARALHATWSDVAKEEGTRIAGAAARVMGWTLEALEHDEYRNQPRAAPRWKRA